MSPERKPITEGSQVSINVLWKIAPLVAQCLDHEGYSAFWIRSETNRVTVITDAPRSVVDAMISLASGVQS